MGKGKKRKHVPIVPSVPPAAAAQPALSKSARRRLNKAASAAAGGSATMGASAHATLPLCPDVPCTAGGALPFLSAPHEPQTQASIQAGARAIVWLEGTLRIRDNLILRRAVEFGPGGLAVVVVWRHGRKIPTPSASFMAQAYRALHQELRKLGGGLTVLSATVDTEKGAVDAVAEYARQMGGDACTVVVDASGPTGASAAPLLRSALRCDAKVGSACPFAVVSMLDDTLLPYNAAQSCLERSRTGKEDERVLQWAGKK